MTVGALARTLCLLPLALLPEAAGTALAEPTQLAALTDQTSAASQVVATDSDLDCLALNVYFEARSEPEIGQVAVAAVTLNRVRDPAFPDTICAVVKQGEEYGRHRCQFSWWCDGRDDTPRNPSAWQRARLIASLALSRALEDPTSGALWYHADHVQPSWSRSMAMIAQIGRHLFYRQSSGR